MAATSASAAAQGRPAHVWLGLAGGLVIGAAFAVPSTHLADKPVSAWDLLSGSERALGEFDRAREKLEHLPEPPALPKFGPKTIREKLDSKRDEMKHSAELTESILLYVRWGLAGLLATACLQLVPALWRGGHGFFSAAGWLAGTLGLLFTGTLAVLIPYLRGLSLLGRPVPIDTGCWLVLGGTAMLGLSGLLSVSRSNWKWSLPAQLGAGAAWTGYFRHLLLG